MKIFGYEPDWGKIKTFSETENKISSLRDISYL